MSLISSVPPNGVISGPVPNALAVAQALAAQVASTSATAKLALPTAVLATATVTPPLPDPARMPTATSKPFSALPSTPFNAQVIAQTNPVAVSIAAVSTPQTAGLANNETQLSFLPPLPTKPRANLVPSRGADAYQSAARRNALSGMKGEVDAVLG